MIAMRSVMVKTYLMTLVYVVVTIQFKELLIIMEMEQIFPFLQGLIMRVFL